jgi:hypothetical protein
VFSVAIAPLCHEPITARCSPWAASGSFANAHTAMDAMIDTNPDTKQTLPRMRSRDGDMAGDP